MVNKKDKGGKFITGALITVFIFVMLIILGPASAVIVSIVGLDGASITQDTSKSFNITVKLENQDKYVPISNISLNISGVSTSINATFDPINGTRISGDSRISIDTVTISPNTNYYNYGYGYGVDTNGSGYGYNFGYGYGYGYNSGLGGGIVSFTYQVTLSTTNLAVGSYSATAYLNTGNSAKTNFASSSASFTVAAASSSDGSSGSGSSGGGGGGGTSAENYSNIVVKEKYDLHIFRDKITSYRFKNASNPIMYVNITGNVNAGETTISVEVLRSGSTIVKIAAPGIVYKNANIWVGTSGFATSKNIKAAAIGFKVDNSWLTANGLSSSDVKLLKWDGSQWIPLETTQKEKSDAYTFYEGKTTSFSPFAISAKVSEITSGQKPEVTQPGTPPTETSTVSTTETTKPPSTSTETYLLIALAIVLIVIIAVTLNFLKKKKE